MFLFTSDMENDTIDFFEIKNYLQRLKGATSSDFGQKYNPY